MKRIAALLFGLAAYAFFLATFLYAMLFVEGFGVPKTIDSGPQTPWGEAIAVDLFLLALFATQHSVMARPRFKQQWTRLFPQPIERSIYVLFSTLALALLCWQWRPIIATIWSIDHPAIAHALIGLSFLGWLIVLVSTFLINHFELLGLHQVFNNLAGRAMPAPRFRTPLFYRLVRHPLYFGFMIAFWATPVMTLGHLVFSAAMTAYIVVGALLEERDLVETFGDEYRRYRQRVGMLIPWRRSA